MTMRKIGAIIFTVVFALSALLAFTACAVNTDYYKQSDVDTLISELEAVLSAKTEKIDAIVKALESFAEEKIAEADAEIESANAAIEAAYEEYEALISEIDENTPFYDEIIAETKASYDATEARLKELIAASEAKRIEIENLLSEALAFLAENRGTAAADIESIITSLKKADVNNIEEIATLEILASEKIGDESHSFGDWIAYEGNDLLCCDAKIFYRVCADCGVKDFKNVSNDDHVFTAETVAPTCTSSGYDKKTCSVCGKVDAENYTDALGHEWDTTYSTDNASHWIACANCEETNSYGNHEFGALYSCEICSLTPHANVLIVESIDGESAALESIVNRLHTSTVVNISDVDSLPKTIDALCEYDEVILVNVSNGDMPDGFSNVLYDYVYLKDGALFTVCGNEEDANPRDDDFTANAFTREDMYGTVYQDMLPVEIINYTPPTAVVIIIDNSGSMTYPDNSRNKLDYAKDGAIACLDALTERDYVAIVPLSDYDSENIEFFPRTQRNKILEAIEAIEIGGAGTVYSEAFRQAGIALSSLTGVTNRHVILVTDGEPASDDRERTAYWLNENANRGITASIVGIDCTGSAQQNMIDLLVNHAGMSQNDFRSVEMSRVPEAMIAMLESPYLKEIYYTSYRPEIAQDTTVTSGINADEIPSLYGFYGSRAKNDATVILVGECNVPILAVWRFGDGRVGSFMCDLNGTWSEEFINSELGIKIIENIIFALLLGI